MSSSVTSSPSSNAKDKESKERDKDSKEKENKDKENGADGDNFDQVFFKIDRIVGTICLVIDECSQT